MPPTFQEIPTSEKAFVVTSRNLYTSINETQIYDMNHHFSYSSIQIIHSSLYNHSSFGPTDENGFGGAISCRSCSIYIYETEFLGNHAVVGAHISAISSDLNFQLCSFNEGKAFHHGSIFIGETMSTTSKFITIIYNCSFIQNHAETQGGGIMTSKVEELSIYNTEFVCNQAGFSGGAIFVSRSSIYCYMSSFSQNMIRQKELEAVGNFYEHYQLKKMIREDAHGGGAICLLSDSKPWQFSEVYTEECFFEYNNYLKIITANNPHGGFQINASILMIGSNSFYRSYNDKYYDIFLVDFVNYNGEKISQTNYNAYSLTKSSNNLSFDYSSLPITISATELKVYRQPIQSIHYDSGSMVADQTSIPTTPMTRLPYKTESFSYIEPSIIISYTEYSTKSQYPSITPTMVPTPTCSTGMGTVDIYAPTTVPWHYPTNFFYPFATQTRSQTKLGETWPMQTAIITPDPLQSVFPPTESHWGEIPNPSMTPSISFYGETPIPSCSDTPVSSYSKMPVPSMSTPAQKFSWLNSFSETVTFSITLSNTLTHYEVYLGTTITSSMTLSQTQFEGAYYEMYAPVYFVEDAYSFTAKVQPVYVYIPSATLLEIQIVTYLPDEEPLSNLFIILISVACGAIVFIVIGVVYWLMKRKDDSSGDDDSTPSSFDELAGSKISNGTYLSHKTTTTGDDTTDDDSDSSRPPKYVPKNKKKHHHKRHDDSESDSSFDAI